MWKKILTCENNKPTCDFLLLLLTLLSKQHLTLLKKLNRKRGNVCVVNCPLSQAKSCSNKCSVIQISSVDSDSFYWWFKCKKKKNHVVGRRIQVWLLGKSDFLFSDPLVVFQDFFQLDRPNWLLLIEKFESDVIGNFSHLPARSGQGWEKKQVCSIRMFCHLPKVTTEEIY